MKRENFDIAAGVVDRIDKLERTIFMVQQIMDKKYYNITAYDDEEREYSVYLNHDEIATEVFVQDILEYYVNTLNLELNELRKNLEEI
jgi:hypothetical protein